MNQVRVKNVHFLSNPTVGGRAWLCTENGRPYQSAPIREVKVHSGADGEQILEVLTCTGELLLGDMVPFGYAASETKSEDSMLMSRVVGAVIGTLFGLLGVIVGLILYYSPGKDNPYCRAIGKSAVIAGAIITLFVIFAVMLICLGSAMWPP